MPPTPSTDTSPPSRPSVFDMYDTPVLEHQNMTEHMAITINDSVLHHTSTSDSFDIDSALVEVATKDQLRQRTKLAARLKSDIASHRKNENTASINDKHKQQKNIITGMGKDIVLHCKKINYLHKKVKVFDEKSDSHFIHPENDSIDK